MFAFVSRRWWLLYWNAVNCITSTPWGTAVVGVFGWRIWRIMARSRNLFWYLMAFSCLLLRLFYTCSGPLDGPEPFDQKHWRSIDSILAWQVKHPESIMLTARHDGTINVYLDPASNIADHSITCPLIPSAHLPYISLYHTILFSPTAYPAVLSAHCQSESRQRTDTAANHPTGTAHRPSAP